MKEIMRKVINLRKKVRAMKIMTHMKIVKKMMMMTTMIMRTQMRAMETMRVAMRMKMKTKMMILRVRASLTSSHSLNTLFHSLCSNRRVRLSLTQMLMILSNTALNFKMSLIFSVISKS